MQMESLRINQDIVHEGWLIKSPPTKFWKAKWRQRWFLLKHSGELPGQYFLEYYIDRRCRKLKGKIDLDQCEQVDAGLSFENHKEKYQYMFNVRTPKRIYYLVAENENDMNKWVDAVCQVCGLKAYTQDEVEPCQSNFYTFESQDSPPISPISLKSGPYIPISECFSGPCLNVSNSLNLISDNDTSKKIVPSPPRSPTTDAESTITDDEWTTLPNVNWDTFPLAGDLKPNIKLSNSGIGSWSVKKSFGKLKIVDSDKSLCTDKILIPPRPPKPSHLVTETSGHNYLNLDGTTESAKSTTPLTPVPSGYDSNTSGLCKVQQATKKEESNFINRIQKEKNVNSIPRDTKDDVFQYDFENNDHTNSEIITYLNLSNPSIKNNSDSIPLIVVPSSPPPLVFRELKPKRKTSDSKIEISPMASHKQINIPNQRKTDPPSINRKLKPADKIPGEDKLHLVLPISKKKVKPMSSPVFRSKIHTDRQASISDDDEFTCDEKEVYIYEENDSFLPKLNRQLLVLQYLDLDLETSETLINANSQQPPSPIGNTVYKTVDFLKTEAFNRTRQRIEEERKH